MFNRTDQIQSSNEELNEENVDLYFLPGGILDPEFEDAVPSTVDKSSRETVIANPNTKAITTGVHSNVSLGSGKNSSSSMPIRSRLGRLNLSSEDSAGDNHFLQPEYRKSIQHNQTPPHRVTKKHMPSANGILTSSITSNSHQNHIGVTANSNDVDVVGNGNMIGGRPLLFDTATTTPHRRTAINTTTSNPNEPLPEWFQSNTFALFPSTDRNANACSNSQASTMNNNVTTFPKLTIEPPMQSSPETLRPYQSENYHQSTVPSLLSGLPMHNAFPNNNTTASRTMGSTKEINGCSLSSHPLQQQEKQQFSKESVKVNPWGKSNARLQINPNNKRMSNVKRNNKNTSSLSSGNLKCTHVSLAPNVSNKSSSDTTGFYSHAALVNNNALGVPLSRPPPGFGVSSPQNQQQLQSVSRGRAQQQGMGSPHPPPTGINHTGMNSAGAKMRQPHPSFQSAQQQRMGTHQQHSSNFNSHHHHNHAHMQQGCHTNNINTNSVPHHQNILQHPNNLNYELDSLNSKSSRDVPSTIYLHPQEDEDGLTACADSITVVEESANPNNSGPKNQSSAGGLRSTNRNMNDRGKQRNKGEENMKKDGGMVIVKEDQVEKRLKPKRQRKKKNKKTQIQLHATGNSNSGSAEEPFSTSPCLTSGSGTSEQFPQQPGYPQPKLNSSVFLEEPLHKQKQQKQHDHKLNTRSEGDSTSRGGGTIASIPETTPVSSSTTTVHHPRLLQKSKQLKSNIGRDAESVKEKTVDSFTGSSSHTAVSTQQKHSENNKAKKIATSHTREESHDICTIMGTITKNVTTMKLKEPILKTLSSLMRTWYPVLLDVFLLARDTAESSLKYMVETTINLLPKRDRFWFLLPLGCIFIDFLFLSLAFTSSCIGMCIYWILMLHKLAVLEMLESDSAAFCYTITCLYPGIALLVSKWVPILPYGSTLVGWYAILRWLFRSIAMKNTHLYRVKTQEREQCTLQVLKSITNSGDDYPLALKDAALLALRNDKNPRKFFMQLTSLPESDRIKMANQFLYIFRKVLPLLLLMEGATRGQGFIMVMSRSERILLGYGCAVLRSGYIFAPLIWLCWSIQLSTILCCQPSVCLGHFLFVIGLSSIRLTHYTASLEDMKESVSKKK